MTLAPALDLSNSVKPLLSFWWQAGSQYANTLYAQMSDDGGMTWSTVWSWYSDQYGPEGSAAWNQVQVDVSAFRGSPDVGLRFIAYNRPQDNFNLDFQIDNVLVDEAPADVTLTVGPGADPRHNALLTWSQSASSDFAYYGVFRSSSPGVTPSSQLLATISNQTTLSFQDTNLPVCGQTWYYRVLVWETNGLHTWGLADSSYRTAWGPIISAFPFTESFGAGTANWALDWPWGVTNAQARTGTNCLTDSPGGNNVNATDASATLQVYLNGINRPVLTYWQLYSFELNVNFGFVEISTDNGNSWLRVAGVNGYSGTNWQQQQIDLTPWAGSTVLVRFRLRSNGSGQDDLWYLDDVSIANDSQVAGYPFYDNMATLASATNWLASAAWQLVGGGAQTNTGYDWQCAVGNNTYNPGGYFESFLTLAGTLDFSKAVNPQLSFWWQAAPMYAESLYAEMSKDGGANWTTVWSWYSAQYGTGGSAAWNQVQVNLSGYLGYTNALLRFDAWNRPNDYFDLNFQVAQVLVGEPRTNVVVTVAPGPDPTHSATLSWTPVTSANFAYYAIYRSTSPGVTTTNTLLATIPNIGTLSFTDSSLPVCGQYYYYRVMAYYSDGYVTTGTTDTVYRAGWGPMITMLPFSDQFETASGYWALDWPWGITTEESHSGTHSLSASPGTLYGTNENLSATLQLDLRLANRPSLSFWQMYALAQNRNYGFVEISTDNGATWNTIAAMTGYGGWGQQRIDLGPYAGEITLIRFRLDTGAQIGDDGWYLDDVVLAENPAAFAYPFYDNVDNPQTWTNWIASSWITVGSSAQGLPGFSWRCLTGDGTVEGSNYFSSPLACSLTLAGTLDFSQASQPELWFWWRAGQQWYHTLSAQVSPDGGHNWNTIWIYNTLDSGNSTWQESQVLLTNLAGLSQVGLRFVASSPANTPLQLDFQVDDILVGESNSPTILTASPIASGTVGSSYTAALVATNGAAPYTWSAVTNPLPPGLSLNATTGVLSGMPTSAGSFTLWVRVTDNAGNFNQKPLTLAILSVLPPVATQSTQPFISPGTNVVFCQVTSQVTNQLLALEWSPTLPAGWTVLAVSGDGSPSVGLDGSILLLGDLSGNPLSFNYTVNIPAGQAQGSVINGTVTYQYAGMPAPATTGAQPQLLSVSPRVYHSADCNHDWIIETDEANTVIAYWRAGAYHTYQFSCDGYAPGVGDNIGPLHSADYEPPYWQIDGTELNRVLAYWRAGCYHPDTNGPDGYAPGCATLGMIGSISQQAASFYAAGSTITVTNTLNYSGSLLSLLWRPILPAGWTLLSAAGDGSPELLSGEITWTGTNLPPSPIQFTYAVQATAGDTGLKQIRGEVEYMLPGDVSAIQAYANPDPLTLTTVIPTPIKFSSITLLPGGNIQLGLQGATVAGVRVVSSPTLPATNWTTLVSLPPLAGSAVFTDTTATNSGTRYYWLVSP